MQFIIFKMLFVQVAIHDMIGLNKQKDHMIAGLEGN